MQIVLRAAALYFFVWLVMRASGRKELGQITAFELVIMVVLGDLIQQGVTGDDRSVVGAMLAVATFALLTVGVSYLSFRVPALRPTLEGVPVVIVRDGRLLEETLRIERLTPEEVLEQARKQGIADLAQVALGVLESDGAFSFVKRQDAD
jgi:uncharacterized membrane protein YcaP (DUF421 family)